MWTCGRCLFKKEKTSKLSFWAERLFPHNHVWVKSLVGIKSHREGEQNWKWHLDCIDLAALLVVHSCRYLRQGKELPVQWNLQISKEEMIQMWHMNSSMIQNKSCFLPDARSPSLTLMFIQITLIKKTLDCYLTSEMARRVALYVRIIPSVWNSWWNSLWKVHTTT